MKEDKLSRVKKYNTEEITKINIEKNNQVDEEEPKEHSFLKKLFIATIFIVVILLSYSTLIAPYFIDVKEYKIESELLENSYNGLKIVQFSDIHYGHSINKKQLDKIVKKINELKPDIIFFTGDLISKDIEINDTIISEIKDSLSKLECTLYKYAIYGDEDNDTYKDIMENTNFFLLNNESKLLYYKNINPIVISGLSPLNKQDPSILNTAVDGTDVIPYFQIVLVHEPDSIDNLLTYAPEVIMSGHTLGGEIKLPYLKPLFLPINGQIYYEDTYNINSTQIFVSNGLGTSGLNARFNNHPSINLYRLYSKSSQTQ